MYAVHIQVRRLGEPNPKVLLYGPYRTAEAADEVRLKLGEQALRVTEKVAGVNVEIAVLPCVHSGLPDLIEGN